MKTSIALLLLVICGVVGCSDLGDPYTPPRIVPGTGMEGVRLGDSRSRVREILGKPDGGGLYDGIINSGTFESWAKGSHAGLSIYYDTDFDAPDLVGPVDGINIAAPFAGKTAEGIGIGTRLNEVLGQKSDAVHRSIDSSGAGIVIYCASHRYFIVTFQDSVVARAFIGWYRPPRPDILPFYCP
jgi:hypothetical protein